MPTGNEVTLTFTEMIEAALAGVMRQVSNLRDKRQDAHSFSGPAWQVHIEGCLGERALAKYLGLYWAGVGKLRAPDVGEVDVRTTPYETGHLLLHPDDPDERTFYLLIGSNGVYEVRGWCAGRNGKVEEFWKELTPGRPAFCVPQDFLIPAARRLE